MTNEQHFWGAVTEDPIALYAAVLSTIIAVGTVIRSIYQWATKGPQAWIGVINPLEVYLLNRQSIEIVIANTGTIPFVVKEICISEHHDMRSPAFHTARFYHGSRYDPSMKTIPNPNGKPNSYVNVPHVLQQGDEAHHQMYPSGTYDPEKHWLRAQVTIRTKSKPVIGWAAPIHKEDTDELG